MRRPTPPWDSEELEEQKAAMEIWAAGAVAGVLMSRFDVGPLYSDDMPTNQMWVWFDDEKHTRVRVTVALDPPQPELTDEPDGTRADLGG